MPDSNGSTEDLKSGVAGAITSGATNYVVVYEKMRAIYLFNQRRPLRQRLRSRKLLALLFIAVIAAQAFNVINISSLNSRVHRHQADAVTASTDQSSSPSDDTTGASVSDDAVVPAAEEDKFDARKESSKTKTSAAMSKIIVTTKEIPEGATISADALEERWMNNDKIPDGAVSDEKSILGKTSTYGVSADQIVSNDDIGPTLAQLKKEREQSRRAEEGLGFGLVALILFGELFLIFVLLAKAYGPNRIFVTDQGIQIQWFGLLRAPLIPWTAITTVGSRKIGSKLFSQGIIPSYQSQSIDIAVNRSSYPINRWSWLRLGSFFLPDAKLGDLIKQETIIRLDAQAIVHESDRKQFIHELESRVGGEFMNPAIKELLGGDEETPGFTKVWLDTLESSGSARGLDPLQIGDALAGGEYEIMDRIATGGQAVTYEAKRQTAKINDEAFKSSGDRRAAATEFLQAIKDVGDSITIVQNDSECVINDLPEKDTVVVLKEFVLPERGGIKIRNRALANIDHEASLLRRIENPHVVKYVDSFVQGNRAYLVMEKVEGHSLRQLVQANGALTESQVRDLANQMCDILQYLHEQTPPIIHRDFTPDNLMLKPNGELVLIDFNVAEQLEQNCTKAVVGKHCYMPPEQFRGYPTIQSDIYAMGATLFYLLTGEDPEAITASHPRRTNPQISESIDSIVSKATDPSSSQRYKDSRQLRADLTAAIAAGDCASMNGS